MQLDDVSNESIVPTIPICRLPAGTSRRERHADCISGGTGAHNGGVGVGEGGGGGAGGGGRTGCILYLEPRHIIMVHNNAINVKIFCSYA